MAHELRVYHVAVVSLYPGLSGPSVCSKPDGFHQLGNSESPQFIGRAVTALAADSQVLEKTGQVLVAAELAVNTASRTSTQNNPSH